MAEQSPFRILAIEYAADMLSREDYIAIRSQMLALLQDKGAVSREDLENFVRLNQGEDNDEDLPRERYSASDWLIIGLGLVASLVLAYILYT